MPPELQRSFRLYVTHVDGEGPLLKICGQIDQPSSLMVESLFQTARDDLERGIGSVPPAAIQDCIICAAKYKDGAYYRAKIISTKNLSKGLVGVFFVDFGNKDIIPLNAIRFLDNYDPMFLRLPSLVNEYYLARFMHPSGRWEDPLLLMLQNILCYTEHPVTVEGLTHTLPIISLQLKGTDLSTHLVAKRLGVDVPVPKQIMMLAHPGGDILQAANWQHNFMVESPCYTEHVPFLVDQDLSPKPASAPCLQQIVPFSGATVTPPSAIFRGLNVNKPATGMANLRAPIRRLRESSNFPPIMEGTPTPAAPATNVGNLSPKKLTSYKSHMLECNSVHKVFVSFVEDGPELFTVQLMTDIKRFQNMMDDINRRPHTSLTEPPMIGSVCLGRISEDRIICRSIVMNLSGSQCKLYFVDLGDTEMVSYYDVFDIPEEFMKPDVFALRFCLSGVKSLPKSPYLNEVFKELVSGKVMSLRVVAPEGPPLIQYGELYLDNKNVMDVLLENMKDKLQFKWMDMLQLGSQYSVLVSYVDSCLKFYVQLSNQINDLNIVMKAVKAHCETTSSPGELPTGAACCARFADDGNWYRACVCSIKDNKVVVAYVDYGNEQEVAVSDLRTITPDLIKLPAQALKCALKGFENRPIETNTSERLEKLVLEKTLIANIVAVLSGDTMLVTLTDNTIFPPLDVARKIDNHLQPKIIHEMNVTAPVGKRAPEPFRPLEARSPDAAARKGSFREERRRDLPEALAQQAGSWQIRENRNPIERTGHSLHSDKSDDQPDHRRGERENRDPIERTGRSLHRDKSEDRSEYRRCERRGKPWDQSAPIEDWREALEPRRVVRANSDNKSNKQDEWEENKTEERSCGARFERREPRAYKEFPRRETRERGDRDGPRGGLMPRDRSIGSDKSAGRAPPPKPRGPFTHAQYKELAEPVPLDTPFAEPAVEPGAQHEVAVTWIISPQSFYTQILAQQPRFLEMMHRIPELYKGVRSYCGPVGAGASVLARYPADGVLYRATVVAVQPLSKFVVQYVDFGNKQLVDAKDVWQLERQLMELPRMAVHCCLLGVAPPAGEWRADPEVDLCFNAPRYQCVFAESAGGQQRVSLWSNGASVADALLAKGLAARADPPPAVALKDEAVDLTIIVGQQIPCRVTHVQSFDKFYVQLDLEKAALVERAVAACDAALLTPLAPDSLADGVHCTVRHEGRVFRAILSDTADAARVAAVLPDYGRTITTSLDHLMILPTELSVYYYQSLECCLNNYSAESRRLLSEDGLKARLVDRKFIVYVDSVEGISLLTTLYDLATGQKLALFEPDEGAFAEVAPLCPRTVFNYNFGLASVQHLERLDEIHLQRCADVERVQALLDSLFAFYEEGSPEPLTEFAADTLCAAKSADENWYRAVVVSASEDAATVQFPDYGNSETVPKARLRKLDPRFHEPCAQALVAGLGLEALQESALARLAEWTAEQEVQVTLACGADGWLASLHLDGVDLSMRLVDEKLAAPAAAAPEPEPAAAAPPGCSQVYISHIDTPGHFWLQPADKVARIDEIQAELQARAADYPELAAREVGALCAARYSADEQWYRAQLLDLDADIATVRFVDYGNTDVLDNRPGVLRELPAPLRAEEPLALRSSVNAVPTGTGQWSEPAADSFAALVGDTEAPVAALVVLTDETTYVDLFVGGENLTDRLVAQGHAARAEQPECGDLPACFASHVNSPAEFWLQLESAAPELQAMEAAMVDAERFPALPAREEGALCAAKYPEDEAWYRAQVIVDGSEGTEVLFMDYGNASIATELRSLPAELRGKPALSRKCALQKPRDIKAWSRRAETRFTELAAEGATVFQVQFIASGDVSIVELFLDGRSVTEQLVGLCEERPAPELLLDGEDITSTPTAARPSEPETVATSQDTEEGLKETNPITTDTDLNEELHSTNKVDLNEQDLESDAQPSETDHPIKTAAAGSLTVSKDVVAAESFNENKIDNEPESSVTMHEEEDEFEDANDLNSSKMDESLEHTHTVIKNKSFEANLECLDDTDDKADQLESPKRDPSSEMAEGRARAGAGCFTKLMLDAEHCCSECAAFWAADKQWHRALAAGNIEQCMSGEVSRYLDDEDISSTLTASRPDNVVNDSTVEVDLTKTSEKTNQEAEANVPFQVETEVLKVTNLETLDTDEALIKKLDSTDYHTRTVATNNSMTVSEGLDSAPPTSDSEDISLVFSASKSCKPENRNVLKEQVDFIATSEVTSQDIEATLPSQISDTKNVKETIAETVEIDCSETLRKEIDSTNKTGLSVPVAESVAQLMDTDKTIQTVDTYSITDPNVDLATLTSNGDGITSVFRASKCSELKNENVSTEEVGLTATSETNLATEVAVPSQLSESETLSETIDTGNTEALLEEVDSTDKIEGVHFEESVALLTNTDKPIGTVATSSITFSIGEDSATTSKGVDSTTGFSASKCSEPEKVNVLSGELYISLTPEATIHDTEAAVASQVSETEDLKESIPESKETVSLEALLEEIDCTNKTDFLSDKVEESVAQLTGTGKPIETAAAGSIITSNGEQPATLTFNYEDSTSVISASKCSEPENVNVPSEAVDSSQDIEAAMPVHMNETENFKTAIAETTDTENSEALLQAINSTKKIKLEQDVQLDAQLKDTDKPAATEATESIIVSKGLDSHNLTFNADNISSILFASKPTEPENVNVSTEVVDLNATSQTINQDTVAAMVQIYDAGDLKDLETIPESIETDSSDAYNIDLSVKVVKSVALLTGTDKPIETAATGSKFSKIVDSASRTSNDENSTSVCSASKYSTPGNVSVSSEDVDYITSQDTEAAVPSHISETVDLKENIPETINTNNSEALKREEVDSQLTDTDKAEGIVTSDSTTVSKVVDSATPTSSHDKISSVFSASNPAEELDFTVTSDMTSQVSEAAVPSQFNETEDSKQNIPETLDTENSKVLPEKIETTYKIDSNNHVTGFVERLSETNKATGNVATDTITILKEIDTAAPNYEDINSVLYVSKPCETENANLSTENVNLVATSETSMDTKGPANPQNSETKDLKETIPITIDTGCSEGVSKEIDTTNKTDVNGQVTISAAPPTDTDEPTERMDPDCMTLTEEKDGFEDDLNSANSKLDESCESHDYENIPFEANSETLVGPSDKTDQLHSPNEDIPSVVFEKSDTIKSSERYESKDSGNTDTGYTSGGDASLSKDNSAFRDQLDRNPSSAVTTENKFLESDENKTEGQTNTETDLTKKDLIGVDSSMTDN